MVREGPEENSSSQNDSFLVKNISERGSAIEIKFSDSSSFFILASDYLETGLHSGDKVSLEIYEKLKELDEKRHAVKKALNLLSFSPHTEYLLKIKLVKKGFSRAASDAAAEYLRNKELINDRDYAEQKVLSYLEKNPSGSFFLVGMLVSKGVDRETAESVVKSCYTEKIAEAAVLRQVEKLKRNKKNTEEKIIKKLLGKGFSMKEIRKYVSGIL